MFTNRMKGLIVATSCLAIAGCASYATLVGPQVQAPATLGETVRGSGCGMLIWGFIPAGFNSRTERAYRNALAGRGQDLADTQIKYSWYAIPAVGYWLCTEIEGKVVR